MTAVWGQTPPVGREAHGGRYAPLSSNIQGYSQQQVETRMRAGSAVAQPRFELYDALGNLVEPGVDGKVLSAKVTYDETRDIPGSLDLAMLPDERLRTVPFQYLIKAYAGIGPMQDGGRAEWPVGTYVWTKPKRVIHGTTGTNEVWTLSLGDQLHLLQISGVGPVPLIVNAGDPIITHLFQVLALAGIVDASGVSWSDLPSAASHWYTWQTTANFEDDTKRSGSGLMTLLAIARDMHIGLGYAPPKFNLNGAYLAQPDRDWANDPADVIYDTADDGIQLFPAETSPDFSKVANRVGGWTNNPDSQSVGPFQQTNFYQSIVDLNDILPNHYIAQNNTRHYLDQTLSSLLAPSDEAVYWACRTELFNRLAYLDTLTLKRVGFLALHDPPGIVGVRVDRDPELGITYKEYDPFTMTGTAIDAYRLYRETGQTLDLFTLEASSVLTSLARAQS